MANAKPQPQKPEAAGSLGHRLRALRERRGLTQAQLAGDDYSVAFVSRIEAGERTPSPEALAVFAQRLGVSPAYLLLPVDPEVAVALEHLRVSAIRAADQADWREARRCAEALLEAARAASAVSFEVDALRTLGHAEERDGDPESAVEIYEQALSLMPAPTLEERADMAIRLARTHRTLGDLGRSTDLLERMLAEVEPEANLYPGLMARLNLQLSATSTERGDLARARRVGLQGIEFARSAGDTQMLANALWAAAPPMAAADPARALSLIRRAGTLYAELGLLAELGRLHVEIGVVALQAGDPAGARHALARAEELMGAHMTPSARSTILQARAEIELQEGNAEEAARAAREAIDVAAGIEPLEAARARRILGEALIVQEPEAAERELRAAIELFSSAGAQMETARCFRSLGDLLISQGRSDDALAVFRAGLGAVEGAA